MKRIFVFLLFLLNANFAFGYVTTDVPNGCQPYLNDIKIYPIFSPNPFMPVGQAYECNANFDNMHPVFTPNQHTCNPGYYMPANYDGCVACPTGYTCIGGTYTFNDTIDQGIEFIPTPFIPVGDIGACDAYYDEMHMVFTPNQHTCNPGYYMPANYDGCQICSENSYCPGGTYTFNENVAQGITACAAGTFAPAGMWEVAQCGRIFHVGDDVIYLRSVRKTVHALNFDMDMDGVADYFANMTPLSVPMHINSEHGLKILLDGIEYSVYDDTVDLGLYENNPFVPAQ